jgi:hypothetical protein
VVANVMAILLLFVPWVMTVVHGNLFLRVLLSRLGR